MDRRKQFTLNGLLGGQDNIQPAGDGMKGVALLMLHFSGTNATGETADASNLGSIQVERDGKPIHNVAVETLINMLDIQRGSNYLSSTEASTFEASAIVPFFIEDFESSLHIIDEKELNFTYVPASDVGDIFDALNVAVYAQYEQYRELYTPRILRDNQALVGEESDKNFPLNKNNIVDIFLEDVDEVITAVSLQQTGKTVLSTQPFILLKIDTLANNQLEVSDFDLVRVQTHTPGVPKSTINRDSNLSFSSSGSGAVNITTVSLIWN